METDRPETARVMAAEPYSEENGGNMSCPTATILRVLVVDDSADYLDAVTHLLTTYPRVETVERALSGAQALARVVTFSPDLMLVDVAMPDMNGLDLTRVIKAMPHAPKVIIVSLYDTPAYRQAARAAGADGFIGKSQLGEELPGVIAGIFPEIHC